MKRTVISAAIFALVAGGAGAAVAGPGPNGANDFGLCKAYFAGSDTGREHKRNAPPFQALETAAGVDSDDELEERDEKVAEFCSDKTPGGDRKGGGQ